MVKNDANSVVHQSRFWTSRFWTSRRVYTTVYARRKHYQVWGLSSVLLVEALLRPGSALQSEMCAWDVCVRCVREMCGEWVSRPSQRVSIFVLRGSDAGETCMACCSSAKTLVENYLCGYPSRFGTTCYPVQSPFMKVVNRSLGNRPRNKSARNKTPRFDWLARQPLPPSSSNRPSQ